MTIMQLYCGLKDKGYHNYDLSDAEGMGKFDSPFVRQHLELDRREVFHRWYGPGKWMIPFREANEMIISSVYFHAIDYILKNL